MAESKTNKPVRTKPAAAGPGKQKKKFAEDGGVAHLLELSQAITQATSETLERRIETSKHKAHERQLKKQSLAQRKQEKKSTLSSDAKAKTKAQIKAALKSNKREKTKARKEARKIRASQPTVSDAAKTDASSSSVKKDKKPRKSVSFALA